MLLGQVSGPSSGLVRTRSLRIRLPLQMHRETQGQHTGNSRHQIKLLSSAFNRPRLHRQAAPSGGCSCSPLVAHLFSALTVKRTIVSAIAKNCEHVLQPWIRQSLMPCGPVCSALCCQQQSSQHGHFQATCALTSSADQCGLSCIHSNGDDHAGLLGKLCA